MPEGQCCISRRDQHEGHTDKESCHQVLQLHIKCTVHRKDGKGAARARGGLRRGEDRGVAPCRGGAHLCASIQMCSCRCSCSLS